MRVRVRVRASGWVSVWDERVRALVRLRVGTRASLTAGWRCPRSTFKKSLGWYFLPDGVMTVAVLGVAAAGAGGCAGAGAAVVTAAASVTAAILLSR